MQVTEPAAADWVQATGVETFVPGDLLDPKTNIEVGTWYLGRALRHWSGQQDPLPFALGEYNAGRSRVKRWSGGEQVSADELDAAMDIPGTRAYIAAVRARYEALSMYDQRDTQGTELRCVAGNFLFSTGANEFAGRFTQGHFDLPVFNTTIALDGEVVVREGVVL